MLERRHVMKWMCRKKKETWAPDAVPSTSEIKKMQRWYDGWITFRKPDIPAEYTPYLKGIELKEWIYKDASHRMTMEKLPYYLWGVAVAVAAMMIKSRRQ